MASFGVRCVCSIRARGLSMQMKPGCSRSRLPEEEFSFLLNTRKHAPESKSVGGRMCGVEERHVYRERLGVADSP